jgi:asparagine synthase (glutamine-hydrolysing)
MSIQFGKWNFDLKPVVPEDLNPIIGLLPRYGTEREQIYGDRAIRILYSAFPTTKTARSDAQPYVSASGLVFTWDGRLDNCDELRQQIGMRLEQRFSDVAVVAAAFDRWGKSCLPKLIGDWALTVWIPRECTLLLAKDFLGSRHLCYHLTERQLTWSTILDPLVDSAHPHHLCEEYIAGWFSLFPAAHLTPYEQIREVGPATCVAIRGGRASISEYWRFEPANRIRYRTDGQYEEHFRAAFRESIRRRMQSDRPVLAELSGGMDSSSIVCVADRLLAGHPGQHPRLDTVSYYDDAEPDWNERPYFTRIEEQRGRRGLHIAVTATADVLPSYDYDRFAATPSSTFQVGHHSEQFRAHLASHGYRVVLSGLGGDEVLGGVPSPIAELADLATEALLRRFVHQIVAWAIATKRPILYLLRDVCRSFLSTAVAGPSHQLKTFRWLNSKFAKRNHAALSGYPKRFKLFGLLPSFQANLNTLEVLRRQLACFPLPPCPSYEKRYPYLDRELLQFLFAIPRDQLLRPGQRRSLMRRSLRNIVPSEILERKRKAFVVRSLVTRISQEWCALAAHPQPLIAASLGIVDAKLLAALVHEVRRGGEAHFVPILRTLRLEVWMRHLRVRNLIDNPPLGDSLRQVSALAARLPPEEMVS